MTRNAFALTTVVITLAVQTNAAEDAPPTADHVTAAVEQALPFILRAGVDWIEQRECVSCHQVPFMIWSLNAAADRGLSVDAEQLRTWSDWSTNWQHFSAGEDQDEEQAAKALSNNGDILYQLVLGKRNHAESDSEQWVDTFLTSLAETQQEDGSWKAGGQLPLQKRPKPETDEVTTMWTLYALSSNQPTDVWQPRLDAARPILHRSDAGESTEWFAVRLLLEDRLGNTEAANAIQTQLLAHQCSDGGWGWLVDEQSDALGTGIALYALARSGLAADHPAVAGARRFLLNTQQEDGSWPVRSTKEAKRKEVAPTATYWGACWAVIGLAETLDS